MFRYLSALKATLLQTCVVVLTWIFLHLYGDDLNSCISESKEWILPKYHRERMNQIPWRECVWPLVSVVVLYCHRPYSCHRSRGMNLPPTCFCKRGDGNRNPHLLQSCKVFTIITAASRDQCWRWSDLWVSNPPRKEEVQLFLSWGSFGLFFSCFIIMRYCWYLHELGSVYRAPLLQKY